MSFLQGQDFCRLLTTGIFSEAVGGDGGIGGSSDTMATSISIRVVSSAEVSSIRACFVAGGVPLSGPDFSDFLKNRVYSKQVSFKQQVDNLT